MPIPSTLFSTTGVSMDAQQLGAPRSSCRVGRRQFVATVAAFAGSSWLGKSSAHGKVHAAELTPTVENKHFRPHLAVAAYTFRDQFAWMKGKKRKPSGKPIDMHGFIDFCAANDVAAELTAYFFPADIDDQWLRDLRRYAFLKGVTICGTAIGNHFDTKSGEALENEIAEAKLWIDRAAVMGAPHIRFFAGDAAGLSDPVRLKQSVDATRHCADHAASRGVMIGIENHGGITPDTLLRYLDEVDHPWVGINLDTGNFYSADPYGDLEACVDRAVHVQWKATVRDENRNKRAADYGRIASILRKANYAGFIALEYEEGEEPYAATAEHLQKLRDVL